MVTSSPRRTVLTLCILLLIAGLLAPLAIQAQDAQTAPGQALEISPPLLTLSADPGETITTQLLLRNVSPEDLIVSGQVNDFLASGEDGTPKIILDEEESANNPYSLLGWVNPLPDTLLVPREVKTLPVTIVVPADAAPGGHYGVVRFTGNAPGIDQSGVSLSASLGTLMLITVNGDTNESLAIEEFSVNKDGQTGSLFESSPVTFVERLKNDGNTHVQPAGQVTVTDMFGRKVGAVNVNLPPRNILPNSIRRFEQPLDSSVIGSKVLFGKYTAKMELTYGDSGKVLTSQISFWIIPFKLIAAVIVLLVAGFFLLRFALNRYKTRIIESNKTRTIRKR